VAVSEPHPQPQYQMAPKNAPQRALRESAFFFKYNFYLKNIKLMFVLDFLNGFNKCMLKIKII